MSYIDGFVIPVPPGKKEACRDMAAMGNKKVIADPRMQPTDGDMPFDMQR